jgi:hypothetical protein
MFFSVSDFVFQEDETAPTIVEVKHVRHGKSINSHAFHVIEETIEGIFEVYAGLKTFPKDDAIDDPDEQDKRQERARRKFLNRCRNDVAIILPKAIWPKDLQDLFQGQTSGILANPYNTRMLNIANCE